jgi:DNA-binding Xre family transcriptional regulator
LDRICHVLKCEPGALFEIVDEHEHSITAGEALGRG